MSLPDLANSLVTAISERAAARSNAATASVAMANANTSLAAKDAAVVSALAALEAEATTEANATAAAPSTFPFTYGNGGTTAGQITAHGNGAQISPNKTDGNGGTGVTAALVNGVAVKLAKSDGSNPLTGTVSGVSDQGTYLNLTIDSPVAATTGDEAGFVAGDAVVLTVG